MLMLAGASLLLMAPHAEAWSSSNRLMRRSSLARRHVAINDQVPGTTTPANGTTWNRDAWLKGFQTPEEEVSKEITSPDLPKDLVGTYFKNHHAKFEVGGQRVLHPFDADGMVTAATFMGNGTLHFRNRFVRTQGFQKEQRAGKMLYPGQFGNPRPIWDNGLSRKNVANTNVIYWGGRLLALWEAGQPYKLDPLSLGTAGASDLGAVVPPGKSMTAHPRYDAETDRLVAFGYDPDPLLGCTNLRLFEFNNNFQLQGDVISAVVPDCFGIFHDFVVTKNWLVFAAPPVGLGDLSSKFPEVALGKRTIGQLIEYDGTKPSRFYLFRRDDLKRKPVVIEADAHFNYHYANAYEDSQGRVIIDTVKADDFDIASNEMKQPIWETIDFEKELTLSTLNRYILDPKGDGECISCTELSQRHIEFPVINKAFSAKQHRYVWAATGSKAEGVTPFQGLIKVDCENPNNEQVWLPAADEFCGEPCFAPRERSVPSAEPPAEDDGYIMTMIMKGGDGGNTDLAILDAKNIAKGPICRVPLETKIPFGLHGSWSPEVRPTPEQLNKASVLLKMYERKSKEWNQVEAGFSGLGIVQFFGQKGVDGR